MVAEHSPTLLTRVKEKTKDRQLTGFTPGQGPLNSDLMLVGEAPGCYEEKVNIPFSGASDQELTKLIESIGYSRSTVCITSVARQRPYSIKKATDKKTGEVIEKWPNWTPTKKEALAFTPLPDWELTQVRPKIIATLGNMALQWPFDSQANIGKPHGQLLYEKTQRTNDVHDGYELTTGRHWIMLMYHPAAVLYARRSEPTIKADW